MSDFEIAAEPWNDSQGDESEIGRTEACITINALDRCLTELEDLDAHSIRKWVNGSVYPLAVWFAANWWRLRWEPNREHEIDWKMSHNVRAAGFGYAWPPITIWSEGDQIRVTSTSKTTGRDNGLPVRYLSSFDEPLSPDDFELGVDHFFRVVRKRLESYKVEDSEFQLLLAGLDADRLSEEETSARKLEALLGLGRGLTSDARH